MTNAIFFFKSLHVVGFVAWFAGLFYLVRIFVYHAEAQGKGEPEGGILRNQYNMMEWRVYRIICNPALVITWAAGLGMLAIDGLWRDFSYFLMGSPGWLIVKLVLLVLMTAYHFWCRGVIRRLERGASRYTDWQFRLLNEMPTLFLVSISFIAVYGKGGTLNYLYLFGGIVAFVGLLFLGARAYKRARARNPRV